MDAGQEGSERAKAEGCGGVGGIFCLALEKGVRQLGEATLPTQLALEH